MRGERQIGLGHTRRGGLEREGLRGFGEELRIDVRIVIEISGR